MLILVFIPNLHLCSDLHDYRFIIITLHLHSPDSVRQLHVSNI
jgi:hypothetical protein